ncbi:uncharacterized protein [Cicer arietinum]|uniref:Uncharacterized protein LOC101507983 n=1 Tax=Cicer arietinum TaxID=3827 RepID=A0A3Q7Y3L2_CICAR|nr:uncharacterized protein LOC101507983 [Cicer arietinum]
MSIISWNYRGLGNLRTVPNLKFLVRNYNSDIIFLYKTLVNLNKIEELRVFLGYDFCFSTSREGRGGGIAMLCHSFFPCVIIGFLTNHIDVEAEENSVGRWRLTGYYNYPKSRRRRDAWNMLRNLAHVSNLPWCIIGDFNDILSSNEKKGRVNREQWLINGFRQAVSDSELTDVHMDGYPFTWFKILGTERAVEERLDCALANSLWHLTFPNANLVNLGGRRQIRSNSRTLKFKNAWLLEPEFDDFVRPRWLSNYHPDLLAKLEICAHDMAAWGRINCLKLRQEITQCKKALERERELGSDANVERTHNVHAPVLNALSRVIDLKDNDKLFASFLIEEFKEAVFSMEADQCLGPNGLNPRFYHHFWSLCGSEIFQQCCDWLLTGVFPSTLNVTNITLIPKGDEQKTMTYWRPIALLPNSSILENAMEALEIVHYMKSKTRGRVGDVTLKLDFNKAYDRIGWVTFKRCLLLWVLQINGKVYDKSELFSTNLGHNPSYGWRSIWSAKPLLHEGSRWSIGNMSSISLWNNNWLSDGSNLVKPSRVLDQHANACVDSFLMPWQKEWNSSLVTTMFDPSTVQKILKTPLLDSLRENTRVWKIDSSGMYTV